MGLKKNEYSVLRLDKKEELQAAAELRDKLLLKLQVVLLPM